MTGTARVCARRWRASLLLLAALAAALPSILLAGPEPAVADACPNSNPPNTLRAVAGTPQTTQLGKPFNTNLQVVLANSNGCPVTGSLAGISVTFAAPA